MGFPTANLSFPPPASWSLYIATMYYFILLSGSYWVTMLVTSLTFFIKHLFYEKNHDQSRDYS